MKNHLLKIYDQALFAYLYFWGGKKSGFINYGYWNDDIKRPSDAHFLLFNNLFKLIESEPKTILDLGCGFGGASFQFLNETEAKITGVTHSSKQAAICEKRCLNQYRTQFIVSTYDQFFKTAQQHYDLIWLVESAYHEIDKSSFLAKLKKQLSPKGKILIVDYYLNDQNRSSKALESWFEGYKIGEIITNSEFLNYAADHGLRVVENLDWSTKILEGSNRIMRLGKLTLPMVWLFNKLGFLSNDFLKGTKASIAQYSALKAKDWSYRVHIFGN